MEEIHLTEEQGEQDPHKGILLFALRGLRGSHRPYQTHLFDEPGNRYFTLSTTHKDTFLSLGRLDTAVKLILCKIFAETFHRTKDPEIVFTFEPEDPADKPRALQVIRTEGMHGPGTLIFHLSPIH